VIFVLPAGIRFFRACVGLKNEFYNKHIIKLKLFELVFDVFKRNGMRNNLLNSSIIDVVEFIKEVRASAGAFAE